MKEIKLSIRANGKMNEPEVFFRSIPEIFNRFKFVISKNPDFVIYYDKRQIPQGNFVKIGYAREYMAINMNANDWGLGWLYEESVNSDRYLRYPNYLFHGAGTNLVKAADYDAEAILKQKTKFCAFVFWHSVPVRNQFFSYLSKYKMVDAPGPCCTNSAPIGGYKTAMDSRLSKNPWEEKMEYLKQFKFTIAFENRSDVGYTSEKIYHPMASNSIPIYYGNPFVHRDFNQKSFVNAHSHKFSNQREMFECLMRQIRELDQNDDLYLSMLKQPWYNGNKINKWADRERVVNFFTRIFNSR